VLRDVERFDMQGFHGVAGSRDPGVKVIERERVHGVPPVPEQ